MWVRTVVFNGVLNLLGIKGIYLQMISVILWWYEQDLYFLNSTHHNAYKNPLFKVIHWCRGTVCSKIPHAVQSYPKCWSNFGQQYLSFLFILNCMPYNLNMKNIIIHNKTCDMLPSISSTILHVRYSEHANSKSIQISPFDGSKNRSLGNMGKNDLCKLTTEHTILKTAYILVCTLSSSGACFLLIYCPSWDVDLFEIFNLQMCCSDYFVSICSPIAFLI